MKIKSSILSLSLVLALAGCATTSSTQYVDPNSDNTAVMGLDYKDFDNAAGEMLNNMLNSPLLVHPKAAQGGRYVIAISNITNDTMQRIDTDQLVKKIRMGLLNSGRFVITTAIGLNGPEDAMTAQSRQLRNSRMVNQSTVKKDGQVIAPDYSLSGKILQRNHRMDDGRQQIEYSFQLTLTNLNTGLAYWEDEKTIVKRGDGRTVSW